MTKPNVLASGLHALMKDDNENPSYQFDKLLRVVQEKTAYGDDANRHRFVEIPTFSFTDIELFLMRTYMEKTASEIRSFMEKTVDEKSLQGMENEVRRVGRIIHKISLYIAMNEEESDAALYAYLTQEDLSPESDAPMQEVLDEVLLNQADFQYIAQLMTTIEDKPLCSEILQQTGLSEEDVEGRCQFLFYKVTLLHDVAKIIAENKKRFHIE